MGDGDSVPELSDGTRDGDAQRNEKVESGVIKEGDGKGDVEGMKEDNIDEKEIKVEKMEVDQEENKEGEELRGEQVGKTGEEVAEGTDEMKTEASEANVETNLNEQKGESVEAGAKDGDDKVELNEECGNKAEDEVDNVKDVEECQEEVKEKEDLKEDKGSKKHSKRKRSLKRKGGDEEGSKNKKTAVSKKKEEPKTPAPTVDRPVRERKSVERLVASIENDAIKEFRIEKGRGTALKDIPNVAYKLSRKKSDEALKLLHSIIFSRRGKAAELKNHVLRFSGFVWHDNEEKEQNKVKEKLDKCVKEKLVELCDILDIPISKTNARKEDVIVKLMEFLEAPHATTSKLLSEKEQSSKGKKRKRDTKSGMPASGVTPSKQSSKSQKTSDSAYRNGKEQKSAAESQSESEEEDDEKELGEDDAQNVNGLPKRSEDELSEQAESEEKEKESERESEEEKAKQKRVSKKMPSKKESLEKVKSKKIETSKKASTKPKSTPSKTISSKSKDSHVTGSSPKTSSKKSTEADNKQSPKPKKSANRESTGKKVDKGKGKPAEEKADPSDDDLKQAVCQILKEVDFNTATFTDILKQLGKQFKLDLAPRKSSIKLMVQAELTRLADEEGDEE